jgi:Peptidase propeptide and YPEB domain
VEDSNERRGWRSWGGKAALAVGGMLVGGVLAGTLAASAADNNAAAGQSGAYGVPGYGAANGGSGRHGGGPRGNVDESKSQRPDEHLLTGDTAAKAKAAALAKYPGATVLRVETDSDGVYEAHLTTSGGKRVTVEVDKSFKVTGEESGPGHP